MMNRAGGDHVREKGDNQWRRGGGQLTRHHDSEDGSSRSRSGTSEREEGEEERSAFGDACASGTDHEESRQEVEQDENGSGVTT